MRRRKKRRLWGVWGGSVRGCGRLHVNAKDVTQECSLFLLMDSSPTDSSRHSPSPSHFFTSPPSSTLPPIYIFHTFPTISILRHHLPHINQPLRHPKATFQTKYQRRSGITVKFFTHTCRGKVQKQPTSIAIFSFSCGCRDFTSAGRATFLNQEKNEGKIESTVRPDTFFL